MSYRALAAFALTPGRHVRTARRARRRRPQTRRPPRPVRDEGRGGAPRTICASPRAAAGRSRRRAARLSMSPSSSTARAPCRACASPRRARRRSWPSTGCKRNDIASVVIFDHSVDVLVPAQPVTDPDVFAELIRRVGVRGNTAIYSGVLAGAAEVRKFKEPRRLNRVVLLSDGQANVGPSRAPEFAVLGRSLLAEGISVSTIGLGLGYNEDLMLELARSSDGNHAFAREPVRSRRHLQPRVQRRAGLLRADGGDRHRAEARRAGGSGALAATAPSPAPRRSSASTRCMPTPSTTCCWRSSSTRSWRVAGERELGTVKVAYTAAPERRPADARHPVRARFTGSDAEIAAGADAKVAEAVVEQVVLERSRRAVDLRDKGKFDEAQSLLKQNATRHQGLCGERQDPEHAAPRPGQAVRGAGGAAAADLRLAAGRAAQDAALPPGPRRRRRLALLRKAARHPGSRAPALAGRAIRDLARRVEPPEVPVRSAARVPLAPLRPG